MRLYWEQHSKKAPLSFSGSLAQKAAKRCLTDNKKLIANYEALLETNYWLQTMRLHRKLITSYQV